MQRPVYGHSPPLHHPVPQHVSTVPQLRSPPPPASQAASGYGGSPFPGQQGQAQPGAAAGNMFGQYGNFINDPAAQLASQFGQSAIRQGQEYLEQNYNRWFNILTIKHYFNVTNSYVITKLYLILFPWRHKPWSRKTGIGPNGREGWYLPPRDDINSPDMYIPVMSVVTYIFLTTLITGLRGQFKPELFWTGTSSVLALVILEIAALKFGCYIVGISNESLLDLVAYSGYKFVGVIVTVSIAEIANAGKGTGGWVGWTMFIYAFLAVSLFLLRSLKYVLLPENGPDGRGPNSDQHTRRSTRNRINQFLFIYSYPIQFLFMWFLSRV